jgi:1-deoxy-D-xylulose-5-phosphate reductoisomerase
MGAKITVDSATLMNKGFEIIEAVHLFDISEEQIQVVVHPESIIHSAVEYIDNTVICEMSKPDMRSCIQYAVTYPYRVAGNTATLDLFSLGKMTFFAPNTEVFPLLDLARYSIAQGGALPAVLNAANEVAVSAFLKEQISFTQIFRVVTEVVEKLSHAKEAHTLEEILYFDSEARRACIF